MAGPAADDVLSPVVIAIGGDDDVARARRAARRLAQAAGLLPAEAECVVLAASELATNLARYAVAGTLRISLAQRDDGRAGVEVVSEDAGPGIADIALALQDGYSTGGGLGGGLPGVKRLMDTMELTTSPQGTRIVTRKWRSRS